MDTLTRLLHDEIITALGWTLLHSLWQGLAIASLLSVTLVILRRRPPQVRYIAGLAGLGLLVAAAAGTFVWVYEPATAIHQNPVEISVAKPGGELVSPLPETDMSDPGLWETVLSQAGIYFQRHLPLIVALWLLGVLVLTLRSLGELAFIQHLRHNRSKAAPQHWRERLRELAARMGLSTSIELRESRRIHTPMVIGIFKPVILLPVGMVANLPPEQVESALAHELAHIRRYDYLVNLLQSLVEILFFFNPGVWWLSGFIRAEREHCCDDWAVEVCGDEMTFVKTLAALEEYRVRHAGLVVALAGSRGSLLGRIQRLLNDRQSIQLPFRIFWSALICLMFFGLAAFGWAKASPEQRIPAIEKESSTESEITRLDSVSPEPLVITEASSGAPSLPGNREDNTALPAKMVKPEPEIPAAPAMPAQEMKPYIQADTIPESEKAYRKKTLMLQKEYRERLLELQKQRKALNSQIAEQRAKLNQEENARMAKALEVKKKVQLLQNEKELERKELEIELNELKGAINEVEGTLQQLEQQTLEELAKENPDKDQLKKWEEEARQLKKKKLELHQQINRKRVEQQRQMLELEKQMQEFNNLTMLSQQELQLQQNQLRGKMFELQQEMQELESQMQLLENELQMKLLNLQLEYQAE